METLQRYPGGNEPLKNSNKLMVNISEFALFLLTLMVWTDRILMKYVVRAALMRVPFVGVWADEMIAAAYIVLTILALPLIFKKLRYADIFFGLVVLLVCILNFLFFPNNLETLEEHLPTFLLYTFPLYYIGVSLDFKKMYPWLYRLSLITIVVYTGTQLFFSTPMDEIESLYEGDMWGSYNLLPHVCVVVLQMLKKANIVDILVSVIGMLMIASLGSRGSLLCLVLAIVLYLILFKQYKNPIRTRLIIIVISIAIVLCMDSIMMFLYTLSEEAGLSVRIFDKYFEGTLTDSTARDTIREQLYTVIAQNPIFGSGLYADRVAVGIYAHNLIVELWVSFGIFFGTAILASMIGVFVRTIKALRSSESFAPLVLPLFVSGFVKLFMSGSYTNEMYLFLLVGLCIGILRKNSDGKQVITAI